MNTHMRRNAAGPYCLIAGVMVLIAASPGSAQQSEAAGRIRVVSGSALILRAGQEISAQAGQTVFEADGLRTGTDGRLGVTLGDDTRISLGPSTEVSLAHYVYAPSEDRLGLVLRVLRGAVGYVSGRLAKLAPDSIRLETPAAIVGVRGTSLAIHVDPQ